jgi:hypothetical protein
MMRRCRRGIRKCKVSDIMKEGGEGNERGMDERMMEVRKGHNVHDIHGMECVIELVCKAYLSSRE